MFALVKKAIHKILIGFARLIYILSAYVPKKKGLWVFGAWKGYLYGDNSKYLFEYINRNCLDINAIWITKVESIVNQVKDKGFKAYNIKSLMAKWIVLRAEVVFETEGNLDVNSWLIRGSKIIQLWHGMGIKDVQKWKINTFKINKYAFESLLYAHRDDYWMMACDEAVKKYSKVYDISSDRVFITGQPKDDSFINGNSNSFVEKIRKENPNCKVIAYLPTHRNFGKQSPDDTLSYNSLLKVNHYLEQNNFIMIFKPHFHELSNFYDNKNELSNIVIAIDNIIFGDIYEILPSCDLLLTDYSGIMLGYLSSGKPIIYFPYDFDEYSKIDAGLCYEYSEVTAGPICYTWDEVMVELSIVFTQDNYKDEREVLRQRFSPFNDGKNCERVYHEVKKLTMNK